VLGNGQHLGLGKAGKGDAILDGDHGLLPTERLTYFERSFPRPISP
jgi:hypothetical protein